MDATLPLIYQAMLETPQTGEAEERGEGRHRAVVISYGATGTGKTFLQQQLQRALGLRLLEHVQSLHNDDAALTVSAVEVLDSCRDLLASSERHCKQQDIPFHL